MRSRHESRFRRPPAPDAVPAAPARTVARGARRVLRPTAGAGYTILIRRSPDAALRDALRPDPLAESRSIADGVGATCLNSRRAPSHWLSPVRQLGPVTLQPDHADRLAQHAL